MAEDEYDDSAFASTTARPENAEDSVTELQEYDDNPNY